MEAATQNHQSSHNSEEQQQRRYALRERSTNHHLHSHDVRNSSSRGDNQSHHIDDKMTQKWAAFYPNENVAVVTSTSKPPLPPSGYVPLRVGHERPSNNANDENKPPVGISLNTLLWDEKLLEDRLTELNAWTRRSPPTQRQKLNRINLLLNRYSVSMTSLLLHWLNDELHLHRRVEVLERDLCNGYIFAEVLHSAGLEKQLDKYEDKLEMPSRIYNMELLGASLEKLGIPFPVRQRRAIMMEDRSAALQFLLQLKDFIQKRTKKHASTSGASSVKAVISRVYAESRANKSKLPQDVEERFVKETADKLRPQEVEFRKDVNMAVHLRKFEQAQWTAENELFKLQEDQKAANAADSASGIHAVRTHLKDKRAFMKGWDKEHHDRWKETQRLYMMAERDDLRLELTMQERTRIHEQRRLNFIQQDADEGVVNFEKNMTRLGMGGASTASNNASPLRAIPVTDTGALTHFKTLEQRVKELEFRPSNNVKMMKELRARRKEKDWRMRRRKSNGDQSSSTPATDLDNEAIENLESPSATLGAMSNEVSCSPNAESEFSVRNIREKYLESKRVELEANYDQLREIGEHRREFDMQKLHAIRAEGYAKADFHKWEICADAAEALISLAFDCAMSRSGKTVDMEELKRCTFLRVATTKQLRLRTNEDDDEMYELKEMTKSFLSHSGVWREVGGNGSAACSPLSPSSTAIHQFVENILAPCDSLDTTWIPRHDFKVVCMFTEESDTSDEYPRRIAMERGMSYANVDLIVDECIQKSIDPQKQADAAAPPLSDLERDFSALGLRVSGLRQKNMALPEALVVEIVSKYIQLMQSAPIKQETESDTQSTDQGCRGCVLHNFPRSLEEAKLFERTLIANIDDEETRTSKLAVFESSLKGESLDSAYVSRVDGVVSIATAPAPTEIPLDAESRPPSAQDGSLAAGGQEHKRMSVMEKKSPEALAKAGQEQEALRRLELRAQLEEFWSRSARFTKIERTGMHRDVLAELVHVSIDVMIDESFAESVVRLDCSEALIPELIQAARAHRRDGMGPLQRVRWLRASSEIDVQDENLDFVLDKLNEMDCNLRKELCSRFQVVREVLCEISAISVQTREALEAQFEDSSAFQGILDTVSSKICGKVASLSNRERFFTELEIILGDLVNEKRQQANAFVEELSTNPAPTMVHCVNKLFQMLPSICFVLKEHTMEKIQLLQSYLFDHIPFLRDSENGRGEVVLPQEVPGEAINAAIELCAPEATVTESVIEDVTRILSEIASHFSFRTTDTNGPQAASHALHETNTVAAEVKSLLERITSLCRFANRLKWKATELYEKDIMRLQRYINEDVQSKNASVETAMAEMRQIGSATWLAMRVPQAPLSKFATKLSANHRAHFLSCDQIRALVSAFLVRERENLSLVWQPIKQEEFASLLLETARRSVFPGAWQSSTALASLVLDIAAAPSANSGGHSGTLSSWRKLVFSILCTQFVDFPRTVDIEQYAAQALSLAEDSTTEVVLSRDDFLRLPLWFEGALREDRAFVAELKDVVFSLFSATGQLGSDDMVPSVALVPMLLHWYLCPPYGADVRSDLGDFLPAYSRGLLRAFRVLAHLSPLQEPRQVDSEQFRKFLEFAGVCNKEHRIATGLDGGEDHQMHWNADAGDLDTAAFLEFCDAYDTRLARQFLFANPFDALLSTSSS